MEEPLINHLFYFYSPPQVWNKIIVRPVLQAQPCPSTVTHCICAITLRELDCNFTDFMAFFLSFCIDMACSHSQLYPFCSAEVDFAQRAGCKGVIHLCCLVPVLRTRA